MNRSEQHSIIQELREHVAKMSRDDREAFEMLMKRDRDDEDLDSLSASKLEVLRERYLPKRTKADIEALWNKYRSVSGEPPKGNS